MLTKAGQLFEQCIECSDANTNSYVHYLMLGKVAEKSGQSYDVLLDKYMKVDRQCLFICLSVSFGSISLAGIELVG